MAGRILGHPNPAMYQGAVAALAKLYVYLAGSTTLAEIFSDEDLGAALANPLTADAYGLFDTVWADSSVKYHVVEKTAAGVSIYDEDDLTPVGGAAFLAPSTISSDSTLGSADRERRFKVTAVAGVTLPVGLGTDGAGWKIRIVTTSSGDATLTAQGGEQVDGGTTKRLGPNRVADVWWTGTAFETDEISGGLGEFNPFIPVEAMIGRLTNGPGATVTETTTNKVTIRTADFDASTVERLQFKWRMPPAWDRGTVTFEPLWTHGATTVNFKVSWGLRAVAISNDDPLDAALGTPQYSNDIGGTTDDFYTGPESAAITVAGGPVAGDLVLFEIFRQADDATNDTLAIDARLLGFTLHMNINAGNDA